jgi:hypothetical protein
MVDLLVEFKSGVFLEVGFDFLLQLLLFCCQIEVPALLSRLGNPSFTARARVIPKKESPGAR